MRSRIILCFVTLIIGSLVSCVDDDRPIIVHNEGTIVDSSGDNGNNNDNNGNETPDDDTISGGEQQAIPGFDQYGASLALFQISPSKRVRFSRGNLQYQASTGIWRFAEHQYDYIDYGNQNISSNYDDWIDLFGWGTSGWNSGAIAYQPWSTSTNCADYYPGGDWTKNLAGDYIKADWGRYNAIINGGNIKNKWRTLKSYEWKYLLFTRANAAYKRGFATVNNTNGMVILPDDWEQPSNLPDFVSDCYIWDDNTYNLSQWQIMEESGAIFLPAAGMREGTNVSHTESDGVYWSTIHNDENSACAMMFTIDVVWADKLYCKRYAGLSVRLVTNE